MLRAEDLMIGDWVMWKNRLVQIARVSGIVHAFGQIDVTLAHCNADNLLETHDIKSVSPIPLTPEILEKNANGGWCNYQSVPKGRSIYHIGEVAVYVEWERIVTSPYIELHGLGDTFFKGYVDYVHELQHALRLCRIEKEIKV